MHDLSNTIKDYPFKDLEENDFNPDPIMQFRYWLDIAIKSNTMPEANAMTLSTVSSDNRPSSRIVLLKHISEQGFDFFTNYNSKKGKHLLNNKYASLLFYWPALERQVRIEGRVEKISSNESDEYFISRPYESQIASWASPQSNIIPNKRTLMDWYKEFESIFSNKEISRPPHWGGYRLIPDLMEFWQNRPNRLHDRVEYIYNTGDWLIRRLAP